jgi:acyl-homoserine lactone acylase PvdQ
MPTRTRRRAAAALVAALATTTALATQGPAAAAAPRVSAPGVGDYCLGQCNDVLPPGQNGNATVADILLNKTLGTRPAHTADQLDKYAALVDSYSGLTNGNLSDFFNDSSFGVPADQVESSIQPRSDVTIVRDRATGVPHVFGTTRSGTEFGAGYAGAQDRLWVMDVFRHVGRGKLSSFAGGAVGNRALEQSFYGQAPYTEADLQTQVNRIAAAGARGAQAMADITDYVAGINAYIAASKAALNFPGEYVLTGNADPLSGNGIQPFQPTDMVAIAGVVGGLFGGGGGGEVSSALVKLAAQRKYGAAAGEAVWRSFREENDPEAVLTVHNGQHFPYAASPAALQGVAMPDWGSVTAQPVVFNPTGSAAGAAVTAAGTLAAAQRKAATAATTRPSHAAATLPNGKPNLAAAKGMFDNGVLPADLLTRKKGMSNALLVSGAYTDDGHPIAVFGPQTGYFAPQLLMLEELQGPGISARGATFAGLGMYVLLGRGQDYSWSATSAGQDIIDTFALTLCNTNGSPATKDSVAYLHNGACTAMERLSVHDSWSPTLADSTAAGSYDLVAYRTKYGLVSSRATVGGVPVAYAQQRSTYLHEADSVIGFQMFNDPGAVNSPQTFQAAAANVGYTFNWFYTDSAHIAYFNSGANPVRAANTDPNLPITAAAQYEWQGWNPDTNTATLAATATHPQVIDQDYLVSWNNKQALDTTSGPFGEGSVHRADLLDTRVKAMVTSGTRITRAAMTKAMADAATADLRGEHVLPEMLRMINTAPVTDPAQAQAVADLTDWLNHGALRKETAPGSKVYAYAHTVQTMDAWWPLLMRAQFQPVMGDELFNALQDSIPANESPSHGQTVRPEGSLTSHSGSSFQYGWWSYVDKDLRSVLGDAVAGPLSRRYCGNGNLAACRTQLLSTLAQAAASPAASVYPGDANCGAGDQWCADSIIQSPLGGVTDYPTNWQNRPTYQQVVQYPAHRGDAIANVAQGRPATASSYQKPIFGIFGPSYPPNLAVDGDPTSRWASNHNDNEWITADLGSVQPVSRVILRWEAAYGRSYTIRVSNDGSTWRDVYATTTGNGGVDNAEFAPTTARYVRMQGVARGTGYGYSLYEFEVYPH